MGVSQTMRCIIVVVFFFVTRSQNLPPEALLPSSWPFCSPVMKTANGFIDLLGMVRACADNIPGSNFPPSFFSLNCSRDDRVETRCSGIPPTRVRVRIGLKNLISVNEIDTSVTFSFYSTVMWKDERLNYMNALPYIHPEAATSGIDIKSLVRSDDPLRIWMPDLFITNEIHSEVLNEFILVHPNGFVRWARHVVGTFTQIHMDFKRYPLDEQAFSLFIASSFAYDNRIVELQPWYDGSVVVALEGVDNLIQSNPIWEYLGSSYEEIEVASQVRVSNQIVVYINFRRKCAGIIARLIVPILLFLVIVGFSFYSENDIRIDVALQILLIIAAMYLVIGSAIPQVGYITIMDSFIVSVFSILCCLLGMHFAVFFFRKNEKIFPLLDFCERAIVFSYRTFWIPTVLALFLYSFDFLEPIITSTLIALGVAYVVIYSQANIKYLSSNFKTCILRTRSKQKDPFRFMIAVQIQSAKFAPGGMHRTATLRKELHENRTKSSVSYIEEIVLNCTSDWYQEVRPENVMVGRNDSQNDMVDHNDSQNDMNEFMTQQQFEHPMDQTEYVTENADPSLASFFSLDEPGNYSFDRPIGLSLEHTENQKESDEFACSDTL